MDEQSFKRIQNGAKCKIYGRNGRLSVRNGQDEIQTGDPPGLCTWIVHHCPKNDNAYIFEHSVREGMFLRCNPYEEEKKSNTCAALLKYTDFDWETVNVIVEFAFTVEDFNFTPAFISETGTSLIYEKQGETGNYGLKTPWHSYLRAPAWGGVQKVYQSPHCAGDEYFKFVY